MFLCYELFSNVITFVSGFSVIQIRESSRTQDENKSSQYILRFCKVFIHARRKYLEKYHTLGMKLLLLTSSCFRQAVDLKETLLAYHTLKTKYYKIQDDINYLTSWCSTKLIKLNVKKCKYICFTRSFPTNGFFIMNVAILELVNNSFND